MQKISWLLLAALLIGGIFAVDLTLPLGIASWLLYMLPLLLSLWTLRPSVTVLFTAACSVLILIGFLITGESLLDPKVALLNRMIAILVLWVTVTVGLRYKNAVKEVNRLAENLKQQAAELEIANRDLEAFSYSVAHDLRNPLTVISGYCNWIQEQSPDSRLSNCGGYLAEINSAAQRMDRIIEALLNLALYARRPLTRETVDLSEMARDIVASLRISQPERDVTFIIAENVMADADSQLIRVVLENLLGNSWKYTADKEAPLIEFGVDFTGGHRTYFVRDNGIGFDNSKTTKMFDAFQRMHSGYEGFGIGLAIVKRIIDRHGGEIWADAEVGAGATFFFRF